MIEEMAAKRAAAADAEADKKLASTATAVTTADKAKPEPKKVDVGAVAAMGVAFGAIGTALAYVAGLFKGIEFWQLCLAFVGILLVISGPSMILAWMKLRKRNLGPILDANGWAVNAKARLNVPFGASLTGIAKLPEGATITATDRFGEKPSGWIGFAKFVIVVCFLFSLLNHFYVWDAIIHKTTGEHYLPGFLKQAPPATGATNTTTTVSGTLTNAPAAP
jgi:MFS family permease